MNVLRATLVTLFCWAPLVSGSPLWLCILWYATWSVMTVRPRDVFEATVHQSWLTYERAILAIELASTAAAFSPKSERKAA